MHISSYDSAASIFDLHRPLPEHVPSAIRTAVLDAVADAIDDLARALAADPRSYQALAGLLTAEMRSKNFGSAKELIEKQLDARTRPCNLAGLRSRLRER